MKKLMYLILLVLLVSSCKDSSDKFIGEWKNPNFKGDDLNKILITKMGKNQVLVDYVIQRNVGLYGNKLLDKNGSFKEVGTIDGNIIQINANIKLSLIDNDSKILFNNNEFIKDEEGSTINIIQTPTNSERDEFKTKITQDSIEAAKQLNEQPSIQESKMPVQENDDKSPSNDRVSFVINGRNLYVNINGKKFQLEENSSAPDWKASGRDGEILAQIGGPSGASCFASYTAEYAPDNSSYINIIEDMSCNGFEGERTVIYYYNKETKKFSKW